MVGSGLEHTGISPGKPLCCGAAQLPAHHRKASPWLLPETLPPPAKSFSPWSLSLHTLTTAFFGHPRMPSSPHHQPNHMLNWLTFPQDWRCQPFDNVCSSSWDRWSTWAGRVSSAGLAPIFQEGNPFSCSLSSVSAPLLLSVLQPSEMCVSTTFLHLQP